MRSWFDQRYIMPVRGYEIRDTGFIIRDKNYDGCIVGAWRAMPTHQLNVIQIVGANASTIE